jgi:hypothetical protein
MIPHLYYLPSMKTSIYIIWNSIRLTFSSIRILELTPPYVQKVSHMGSLDVHLILMTTLLM